MLNNSEKSGFTLVELALVLVIIGVLAGLGIGLWSSMSAAKNRISAQTALNNAVEAIVRFAEVNGRLPDQTEFGDIFPYGSGTDYGSKIVYSPADNLTLKGYDRESVICLAGEKDVPAGYAFLAEEEPYSEGSPKKEMSLEELQGRLDCASVYEPRPRILTKSLPPAYYMENYFAELTAKGGRPFKTAGKVYGEYQWCAEPGPAAGLDNAAILGILNFDAPGQTFFRLDCMASPDWTQSVSGVINVKDFDRNNRLGITSIPLKVFVKDAAGGVASQNMILSVGARASFKTPEVNDPFVEWTEDYKYTDGVLSLADGSGGLMRQDTLWGEDVVIVGGGYPKSNSVGCIWYNIEPFKKLPVKGALTALSFGFYPENVSGYNQPLKNGATIMFIPWNTNWSESLCGDYGSGLGYGVNTDYSNGNIKTRGALPVDSLAVEFDMESDNPMNTEWIRDSWRNALKNIGRKDDKPVDHVAVLSSQTYTTFIDKDAERPPSKLKPESVIEGVSLPSNKKAYKALQGSNWHGGGNDSCGQYNPSTEGLARDKGCYGEFRFDTSKPHWIGGIDWQARIELDGRYADKLCSVKAKDEKNSKFVRISVWMEQSGRGTEALADVTKEYSGRPLAYSCKPINKNMEYVRFGIGSSIGRDASVSMLFRDIRAKAIQQLSAP